MSTFYERYLQECAQVNKSPSRVAEEIGLSRSAPNGWRKGKVPAEVTLVKLAQYFGVSKAYLKGEEAKKILAAQEDSKEDNDNILKLYAFIAKANDEERAKMAEYMEFLVSKRKEG